VSARRKAKAVPVEATPVAGAELAAVREVAIEPDPQDPPARPPAHNAKRWLCVCQGGLVRSAALAWVLKVEHGQDAIPAGWQWNSKGTLDSLCEWADYVVVMQPHFAKKLDQRFRPKVRAVDVGADTFGHPQHADLQKFLRGVVAGWAERGFSI
jgi:predicted protein tyrosine phosphatase